jgi:hypothetical protein
LGEIVTECDLEVQAAMEKERRAHGETVLFPIRLDDAVMQSNRAWAADVRRTRYIRGLSQLERPRFVKERI